MSGHAGFVVDKVAPGQVFSEYFGFPANFHSTDCSTFIIFIIRGWYNRPNSGRRAKWTESHPTARKTNYYLMMTCHKNVL
jgi:hypothetical protein